VLLEAARKLSPDVIAVSGDVTQRARPKEFREAREFLERVEAPKVIVPGNHDVPLWDVFERFTAPLDRWRHLLTGDLEPAWADDVVAVLGVDTTHRFTVKGGRLDGDTLRGIERRLLDVPPTACRVLVGHHPLASFPGAGGSAARGGRRALEQLARLGVDAVLSGHLHETHVRHTRDLLPHLERGILLVSAGTASSVRGRGTEALRSTFNVLTVTPGHLGVTTYLYADDGKVFIGGEPKWFDRHPIAVPAPPPDAPGAAPAA
jgi:3',5'-cyclic AMP phosphodiesterase CpdA